MKKVLIIESNGGVSDKIESILTYPDFKIFYSHDNKDGYKIAVRYLPDLILLCTSTDDEDFIFARNICSDEVLTTIPLIIIAKNFSFEQQRIAMESGADDYIPVEFWEGSLYNSVKKRLSKLSRVKQSIHSSINTFDEYNGVKKRDDHIIVKIGNKLKFVEFSDIECITALKEYSKIITTDNCKIVVRKSLKNWIKILPSNSFLRIHRATIININYIEDITKTGERTYTVRMKNIKDTFDFSHRYANIMRRTFPA